MQIMIALRFYAKGTFVKVQLYIHSCQFVADVMENPGGFQSQLNIDGLTLSQL